MNGVFKSRKLRGWSACVNSKNMYKKRFVLKSLKTRLGLLAMCLAQLTFSQGSPEVVSFAQSGAYLPGILGVRDYANPGQSGLFLIDYNLFLNSDTYVDRNGDKTNTIQGPLGNEISLDINVGGYINSLMFVYASPKIPALGNAQYLFITAPAYNTVNTRVALGELLNDRTIEGGVSGFGDLAVAPLMLSWQLDKFDVTGGYLFYAPTGRYKTGASDNLGIGHWSHILQVASYYYPVADKSTALMVMPTYEFHSSLKDADVKPGSRLGLEYGISQYFSERLEVSLQGGHIWQAGEDAGSDVYWDTSVKDRMSVFGAGVGYWLVPGALYSNFKYATTYGLRQHFKANTFQLQLLWIPHILN